jgi:hypothetical protein
MHMLTTYFEQQGLDTIFYVRGIADLTKMVHVIKQNEQVTLLHVEAELAHFCSSFDAYNSSNNKAAKTFIKALSTPTFLRV